MPLIESTLPIVAALIAASGFFSLFEQALKAIRKPRLLQKEADNAAARTTQRRGKARSFHRLLKAVENPDRYFIAARFWIIVLRSCAAILAGLSVSQLIPAQAGIALIVLIAAACNAVFIAAVLLLGGIIPGIIVNRAPEDIAAIILPLFEICALPLRPFYALALTAGKKLHLTLSPQTGQPGITEDELRHALMEGEKSGIVESKEKTMVEGVFYLGDRPLGTFMNHRSEIQWLDINTAVQDIRAKVLEYREQHCFPVADGTLDAIIGAAYLEDVILDLAADSPAGLRAVMKKALFAPETMPALQAFESFKRGKTDFLFVMDEYGGFAGMVGLHDLVEEIVGEFTVPSGEEADAVQMEDGSWLIDGGLNIDDAAELLSLPEFSAASGGYHTLAGFVLSLAGELPRAGDNFLYQGYRFIVLDMDGNRIDKIAVKKEKTDEQ